MKLEHRASHWDGDQLKTVWYWTHCAFRVSEFCDKDRSVSSTRDDFAGGSEVKIYRANQQEREDVFFRVFGSAAIFIAFAIVAVAL